MTFNEIQAQALPEQKAPNHNDKSHILIGTAACGQEIGALAVLVVPQLIEGYLIKDSPRPDLGSFVARNGRREFLG